jgi:hypothetical protein
MADIPYSRNKLLIGLKALAVRLCKFRRIITGGDHVVVERLFLLADALGVYAAYDVSLYGDVRSHDVFHDAPHGRSWAAQKHNGNAQ